MLNGIRNWVIKTMMKSKGETGIVKTIPKRDLVELNTQITAQRLMENGIDPCLLYTSPSPRDRTRSRMPSSA